MKTEEDEAFEDIERRQGGGFKAKQAMAADKVQDVRAYLASKLDCWHRLTGEESDQLVALFEGLAMQEPLFIERNGKTTGVRVGSTLLPVSVVRSVEAAHRIGAKP